MASIIKASINLNEIPKDKIYVGKKGKYLPITITINDEPDQFGNNVGMWDSQTKEQREAKEKRNYTGNAKVVWTDGKVSVAEKQVTPQESEPQVDDDLPF